MKTEVKWQKRVAKVYKWKARQDMAKERSWIDIWKGIYWLDIKTLHEHHIYFGVLAAVADDDEINQIHLFYSIKIGLKSNHKHTEASCPNVIPCDSHLKWFKSNQNTHGERKSQAHSIPIQCAHKKCIFEWTNVHVNYLWFEKRFNFNL